MLYLHRHNFIARIAIALLVLTLFCSIARADYSVIHPEDDNAIIRLADSDVNSRVTVSAKDELRIEAEPGTYFIQFHTEVSDVTVSMEAEDGTVIDTNELQNGLWDVYITVPQNVKYLSLRSGKGFAVSEITKVNDTESGKLTLGGNADVLLVAAHSGDEVSVFSGLLAYCTEQKLQTETVILSYRNRQAVQEALDTAEAFGQRLQPSIYTNQFVYLYESVKNKAKSVWNKDTVILQLVRKIRETKPSVIVTHSMLGENEDGMNAYAAELTKTAVQKANDSSFDKWSAKEYGTHEIKKLYCHVYDPEQEKADVTLDYATALTGLDGRTAKQVADNVLEAYSTIRVFRRNAEGKGSYTLVSSTVGEDTGINDLMEHIDPADICATDGSVAAKTLKKAYIESPMDKPENDIYFRQPGEEAEVVVFDDENGHWEYRSDTLSVLIDKHVNTEGPIVYYVAHVRMRGTDSFRPGFGSFNESGKQRMEPYLMARRAKAVLTITGDQLINVEESQKAKLVRNGILYGKGHRQTAFALTRDMGVRLYDSTTEAQTILDDGIQNTFGFGPVLVRDGEIDEADCKRHAAKPKNPRSGLGIVENGHFVAIVVDGRQLNHSIGVTLLEFAQIFMDEGCTVAYNMDGGVSEGMFFMGEAIHQHQYAGRNGFGSRQRDWADAVMFGYSELVPSEYDTVYNKGNSQDKVQKEG